MRTKATRRSRPRRASNTGAEARLRDELAALWAVNDDLRQKLAGRDATIRTLETERDQAVAYGVELSAAVKHAHVTPPSALALLAVYRAALADIEAVLHRLGTGCEFGHGDAHGGA